MVLLLAALNDEEDEDDDGWHVNAPNSEQCAEVDFWHFPLILIPVVLPVVPVLVQHGVDSTMVKCTPSPLLLNSGQ